MNNMIDTEIDKPENNIRDKMLDVNLALVEARRTQAGLSTPKTLFPRGEVVHVFDKPMVYCVKCKCVTEHERIDEPDLHIDGYVCWVCDEINVNDWTNYSIEGERV